MKQIGLVGRIDSGFSAYMDFRENVMGNWPVVSDTLSRSFGMLMTESMVTDCWGSSTLSSPAALPPSGNMDLLKLLWLRIPHVSFLFDSSRRNSGCSNMRFRQISTKESGPLVAIFSFVGLGVGDSSTAHAARKSAHGMLRRPSPKEAVGGRMQPEQRWPGPRLAKPSTRCHAAGKSSVDSCQSLCLVVVLCECRGSSKPCPWTLGQRGNSLEGSKGEKQWVISLMEKLHPRVTPYFEEISCLALPGYYGTQ